jgi:hypothetical protein
VPKLPLPRLLRDIFEAQHASTPHLKAANATQARIIALLREVGDEDSGLSAEDRAARHREIDELRKKAGRDQEKASRPMEELKARYPRWIK